MNIVLVGGGRGLSEIIRVLKRVPDVSLSAVVSVFDNGCSTGILRQQFEIPAAGDLRITHAALIDDEKTAAQIEERLPDGHAVGNLAFTHLAAQIGFAQAVHQFFDPRVIPVSFDVANIVATLANGKKLTGEHFLDEPPAAVADQRVTKIALTPKAMLNPAAKMALLGADLIVVGPGSLLGSLLPHFAVEGFRDAFTRSTAQKVFVAPGNREFGYRDDTVEEMVARFGVTFDHILTPDGPGRWPADVLVERLIGLCHSEER